MIFLRSHCPDCSHERVLAFTCSARHFCPAGHQRCVRQFADWIAEYLPRHPYTSALLKLSALKSKLK